MKDFEALKAVLDVLKPLDHDRRVKVLAAAVCVFDREAAERALERCCDHSRPKPLRLEPPLFDPRFKPRQVPR